MLLRYNFAARLGKIYAAGHKIVGVPLNWDPQLELVTVAKQPCKSRFWVAFFGVIVVANVQLLKLLKAEKDIASMSYTAFAVSAAMVSMYYSWYCPRKAEGMAEFVNGLIFIEKQHYKETHIHTSNLFAKFANVVFCVIFTTIYCCPCLTGIAAAVLPCSSVNAIATLMPCSENDSSKIDLVTTILNSVIVFCINAAAWHVTVVYGAISCMNILLGTMCQENLLKAFGRMIQIMSPSNESIQKVILFYRQIQQVNLCFNSSHLGILASTLLIALATQSTMMYFMLKTLTGLDAPWPVILSNTLFTIDGFIVILVIFGFVAKVHSTSTEITHSTKKITLNNLMFCKFLKSCPVISIKFGLTNFIEKLTPLKFQDFTIARFIDFILLEKQN